MDLCHLIVLFLIGVLMFTYYSYHLQKIKYKQQQNRDKNNVTSQTVSIIGESVSSHTSAIRPTRIKNGE